MTSTQHTRITRAHETDIPSLLSLNNRYSAAGLTLARTPEFAANHLGDYRVLRGGSWAADHLAVRGTFRNWDHPIRRQIFCGVRTARDA